MAVAFCAAPPRLLLRKGLTEGGVQGFNLIMLTDQEKVNYLSQRFYLSFFPLFNSNGLQNDGIVLLMHLPLVPPPLHTTLF